MAQTNIPSPRPSRKKFERGGNGTRAKVPVSDVLAAVERFEVARENRLAEARARLVKLNMELDLRTVWEKILRKPPRYRTREEVIIGLKETDDYFYGVKIWDVCMISGRAQYNKVQRIKHLAELSSEPTMIMSAEDMWPWSQQ